MKPRTFTLVIFLVLCASLVAAMPEGNEYQESEWFEDFGDYATGAWNLVGVSLEPFVDGLYATATNDSVFGNHSDDMRSITDASQVGLIDNQNNHMQFPPQTTPSLGSLENDAPTEMFQPANMEPIMTGLESERMAFPDLTVETLHQLGAQAATLPDVSMEAWVLNPPYVAGHRAEPSTSPFPRWDESQQFHNLPTAPVQPIQPTHLAAAPLRTLMPAPTRQPIGLPPSPQNDVRPWTCHRDDCDYAGRTEQDLRHHVRYHMPMANRPHGCPYCRQRFLSPREVQRHLPTHGLGRRFYCHDSSCTYSRRGFGRRDHLRRHVRSQHAADLVQQSSETNSVAFDGSSPV